MLVSRHLLLLAAALVGASVRAQPAPRFAESPVFVSGQGGYHTYRIPAIVRSTNGTLLAFGEGRKNSASDAGDIDLVLRRSTNSGITWLPMAVVQEEGGGAAITIGNPAPVVDETTGRIHLLFCRNNDRVFHTVSTNDGITWSTRTEITATAKLSAWDWYATGPCHGIQLRRGNQAGRLVVPTDHRVASNNLAGAHVVFSDDHGTTWQLGGVNDAMNGVNPNETAGVELVATAPGGGSRLYFNTRDQNGSAAGTRGQAWSNDGGNSFTDAFTNRAAFVCPVVQGSVLRLRGMDEGHASNRLLFSCPNHTSSRVGLSVWSSTDEGLVWGAPKLVYAGPSAYSDMARTSGGDVALLYEKGVNSPYETITFAGFNEAWLDAASPAQPPTENPSPAFWNFEEKLPGLSADTNGATILDVHPAGLANHLTAQQPFAYVAGDTNYGSGSALAFDGTGGLQLSDAASSNRFDFAATNSFTIEVVFRIPNGSTQTGALAAKDYGTRLPSWWLRVQNGLVRFLISDDAAENAITSNVLVNDGRWHHVTAVRDAADPSNKRLRLYLDNTYETNAADTTTGSHANAQPLNIGRFGASDTRNLIGDIDMVRITPAVLRPEQFLARYTQFDADEDSLPDGYERSVTNSLLTLGPGDADRDGELDLAEYALAADPLSAASRPRLVATPTPTLVHTTTGQRPLPAWLGVQLESSTDLCQWLTAPGNPVLTARPDGMLEREQTVPFSAGWPVAVFFRLRVTSLPQP